MSGAPLEGSSESAGGADSVSRPALTLLGDASAAPVCDGDVCFVPEARS
jgi:hypothetical protein